VAKWLKLVALIVVIDQATKLMAEHLLSFGQRVQVLPVFDFTLIYNRGAAFSFLAQGDGWQRWFLAGVAILAIAFIAWLMKTRRMNQNA